MPQGNNERIQTYCLNTLLYVSKDLTTNLLRRMVALGGDATKAFKTIIAAAGGN